MLEMGHVCCGSESICRSWMVQVSFPCWEYDSVTGEQLPLGGIYGVNITSLCELIDGSFGLSCNALSSLFPQRCAKTTGELKTLLPLNCFGFPLSFRTMSNGPCILCKDIQLYKASRIRKFGHTWTKMINPALFSAKVLASQQSIW